MKNVHFGVATLLALLFTATFYFGREVIQVAWQRDAIDWVERQDGGAFSVLGMKPGQSSFADAVERLGPVSYFLQRTRDGFNIELEAARYHDDEPVMTVLVQPDMPEERQTALLVQARASGLFSEEALAAERIPFTTLTDASLERLPLRKIEIVPAAPISHDYVLEAHGKPDLTSPVQGRADGAEQAWVYARAGAIVFFRDKEAVRFRYFDPARLQGDDGSDAVTTGAML